MPRGGTRPTEAAPGDWAEWEWGRSDDVLPKYVHQRTWLNKSCVGVAKLRGFHALQARMARPVKPSQTKPSQGKSDLRGRA